MDKEEKAGYKVWLLQFKKVHWHGGRRGGRGLRSSCCSSNSADIFSAPHPLLHHFPQHCCGHRRKFAPMPKQETINWEIQSRLDNSQKLWNIEGLYQNTNISPLYTAVVLAAIYCPPLLLSIIPHWFPASLITGSPFTLLCLSVLKFTFLAGTEGKRKLSTWRIFFAKKWLGGLQLGFRSLSRQGTHGMGSLSGYWSPAKTSWANTLQPSKFWHTTSGLVKQ